jgi:hypothetical protein
MAGASPRGALGGNATPSRAVEIRDLDLETLIWTRGREFPLSWLESRLKCPRCGSRRVTVLFQPALIA